MSLTTKIIAISVAVILFIVITMIPGWLPIRAFDPVFYGVCSNILGGDAEKITKTEFVGLGGTPVRQDYLECGVDPAVDANRICYIEHSGSGPFDENPLGSSMNSDCDECQYDSEPVKYNGKKMGDKCRPYRITWRWIYKSAF